LTANYDQLPIEQHEIDGWRDVVVPVLGANQRLGALFYDEPNDVVTYPVIDLTEEEIRANIASQAEGAKAGSIEPKVIG
jgi:hypothetical protein